MNLFSKKIVIPVSIAIILSVGFLIFSQTALGQRVFLETGIIQAIRDFLNLKGDELSAADYKDGTILLIKPVATGVGEGRYEAGDIVEIRDGEELYKKFGNGNFLGKEERTMLLPLYYPGKLSEEQKQELLAPEYETDAEVRLQDSKEVGLQKENGEASRKMLMRRQVGVDYTQFLSDREILKVRNLEKLKKLPEIDLSVIVEKDENYRGRVSVSSVSSVVRIPSYLEKIEKTQNFFQKLAGKIIPLVFAQSETVKIVDTGNGPGTDYTSLNDWEGAMQGDITASGSSTISVAKCRATTGAADTVAVTISGWTTDATHYIKIWTDPTESYRHNGKWDDGKYRLQVSLTYTNPGINIGEDYVRIDGLQIKGTSSSATYSGGIVVRITLGDSNEIKISNNIIQGVVSGTSDSCGGIWLLSAPNIIAKIWNNIIYDWIAGTNYQAGIMVNGGTVYVYNNTLHNNYRGIERIGGTLVAKNNIVKGSGDTLAYVGTFTSSDYNATDGTDTGDGGAHSRISQTFTFADEANDDFHLIYSDTGAKDYGTSTASDANLAFTDDIDGQTRSGSWDIGADEYQATPIYRSTGFNSTTALASSTGATLTISGSTAVFSEALANNIGVGDVIVYNSVGTTTQDSVAFIHGRTNSIAYTVKNSAGKVPNQASASTNWQVFRAYTSLALAETGTENTGLPDALENFDTWSGGKNLASSTEQWNIAAYADAADTTAVAIDGWTTTADNYIRIYTPYLSTEVGASQRHNGKWDDGKYRIEATNTSVIVISDPYTRIYGLQVKLTSTTNNISSGIKTGSTDPTFIAYNIVYGILSDLTNNSSGIGDYYSRTAGTHYIWNNIVYGFINVLNEVAGIQINGTSAITAYAYNNTVFNNSIGIIRGSQSVFYVKNNISYNNTDNYSGTFDASSTNNLSGPQVDAGMPSTNAKNGVTVQFADAANKDFHLRLGDSAARGYGANLKNDANLAFDTDIDNENRPETGAWDIGADEVARTTQINTPLSGRFIDSSLVGYWSFDGADMNATTAIDRSGNNNDGDVRNGAQKVSGINGQALDFDGVDDYVNCGISNSLLPDVATVSAWVKQSGSSDDVILNWTTGITSSFPIITWKTGTRPLIILSANNYRYFSATSPTNLYDNNWHHVVFIITGNGQADINNSKMYVDGRLQDVSSTVSTGSPASKTGCLIGISYLDTFNGLIDEVRIYNRALTVSEIAEQYRAGAARLKVNTPITLAGPQSGLVGNWSFNGQDTIWSSGTTGTTTDLSGNNNNGTLTNMSRSSSPVIGKVGQALSFDGVDDYVNVNDVSTLSFPIGGMSIAFWMKTPNVTTLQGILGKGETASTMEYSIHYYSKFGMNLVFKIWDADNSRYLSVYGSLSAAGITANKWSHIVATYNGGTAATDLAFYVNGVKRNTGTATSIPFAAMSDLSSNFTIGKIPGVMSQTFNGLIDEARIYNRALSTDEILELYRLGTRKFQPTQ